MRYRDRHDAGRVLADRLARYRGAERGVVLGLPRGGVPVAYEVAEILDLPLDVFLVRKLGTPGHEELAMGAVASGGVRVLNRDVVDRLQIPQGLIERVTEREQAEIRRREEAFRGSRPPPDLEGATVILVDDGLATGATMRAAVRAIREQGPARLVVAVPTASAEARDMIAREVDDMVCADTPEPFLAVGAWYDDFRQTSDSEVRELLDKARARRGA